jgi:hypothetical protein
VAAHEVHQLTHRRLRVDAVDTPRHHVTHRELLLEGDVLEGGERQHLTGGAGFAQCIECSLLAQRPGKGPDHLQVGLGAGPWGKHQYQHLGADSVVLTLSTVPNPERVRRDADAGDHPTHVVAAVVR